MFLKHIDLTTALRPSYLPDEVLLFVQDNVGLYEGKYKLPDQQKGQVYLTSHRICYVDQDAPRANSVALDLKEVERYEFSARFLKSSPKVTIVPKPMKRASMRPHAVSNASLPPTRTSATPPSRSESAFRPPSEPPQVTAATWVCAICSFSNPVPSNFDPATANVHTPLPPCLACGIKPTLAQVLKAAIASANKRATPSTPSTSMSSPLAIRSSTTHGSPYSSSASTPPSPHIVPEPQSRSTPGNETVTTFPCPRCTFSNHPSLLSCEICGASLLSQSVPSTEAPLNPVSERMDSPGPTMSQGASSSTGGVETSDSIKISFRGGGERIFYERLKGSMTQRKWLLYNAPPVPNASRGSDARDSEGSSDGVGPRRTKTAGIAGLEQLGMNMRKNNEILIGNAFEDLEALMASAKDVVALAERFARQTNGVGGTISAEDNAILAESASQLGLVTTKDIVGGGSSESLYLSELARNLAEFLTDDSRGVLKRAGGIITLVDLWAMFNRARGGVELVSPMDFEKAARLWESLKLPVRLRTFRSGVMVAQGRDRTDEATIKSLLSWLQDLHEFPPEQELKWDWRTFGRGVTAREAADRFGWSMGVAEEELLMAEEQGALCREEGLEGLKFWKNYIGTEDPKKSSKRSRYESDETLKALKESGLI
ncbi:EAP30/Vps36 family protein [Sarocladium implicatum]|nr:EAP30/Vps36 family protein [Sarocladium implicatum]